MENEQRNPDLGELAKTAFGSAVRSFRIASDWTQEDLARMLTAKGVKATQTMVAKIERGDRPTPVSEAAVIAGIFGIPIQSLFPLDRSSATASHLGTMLIHFNVALMTLESHRALAQGKQAEIEEILEEWDEFVADLSDEEKAELRRLDIDAAPSSDNGMREKLHGKHPEAG